MNKLLEQFILESRDFLLAIGDSLISLEKDPGNESLMNELFRYVHTLKGNSGLFEFPDMAKVLHAAEDLMDSVRHGNIQYSESIADVLLEVTDFINILINEIEVAETLSSDNVIPASELTKRIRILLDSPSTSSLSDDSTTKLGGYHHKNETALVSRDILSNLTTDQLTTIWTHANESRSLHIIKYSPDESCFFNGEDPFYLVRYMPQVFFFSVAAREATTVSAEYDCYRCISDFYILTDLSYHEIVEYFRYIPEQVIIKSMNINSLINISGNESLDENTTTIHAALNELLMLDDFPALHQCASEHLNTVSNARLSTILSWLTVILEHDPDNRELCGRLIDSIISGGCVSFSESNVFNIQHSTVDKLFTEKDFNNELIQSVMLAQKQMLQLVEPEEWVDGRVMSVAAALSACFSGDEDYLFAIDMLLKRSISNKNIQCLLSWLAPLLDEPESTTPEHIDNDEHITTTNSQKKSDEETSANKVLKVDQIKIDRLMDLIGEMVVAKNALPYLANRAENVFGIRELSREIKSQFAVINRISEEMQDAIMQIRMMPVSTIFQRFPRLIRDISKKLTKEVVLSLEGEDTEADKNIIEKLADPLIHIIRNSLDHGIELPDVRVKAGKSPKGKLSIKATQEGDHVTIEISDDGRGIDPAVIKQKAYEKGVITEDELMSITDKEAIYLIFAPGFSTADTISDLSGRGVGMDVVKNTIQKIGGTVLLDSQVGIGTKLKLILPLSLAVSNVMIITSNDQNFGFPIDSLIETVRLPQSDIHSIKHQKTTILRNKVIPLYVLNDLLMLPAAPVLNSDDEYAVLIVKNGNEQIGLLVDDFQEVVDVILKPLPGDLGALTCYSGTALLGDGSVLMVLNPKGLL